MTLVRLCPLHRVELRFVEESRTVTNRYGEAKVTRTRPVCPHEHQVERWLVVEIRTGQVVGSGRVDPHRGFFIETAGAAPDRRRWPGTSASPR